MAEWWESTMLGVVADGRWAERGERVDSLTSEEVDSGDWELVWQRRICWSKPDATCLEGGCMYCEYGPWKDFQVVLRYVLTAGELRNRGHGFQQAEEAWQLGLERGFFGNAVLRLAKRAKPGSLASRRESGTG